MGGGTSKSSTTSSVSAPQTTSTTTTSGTANGNFAPVLQGQTINVSPGTDAETVKASLDASTANLANGINLINNTQTGAAELISQALSLVAPPGSGAAEGAAAITSQSAPATQNGQLDIANSLTSGMTPIVLAGGAILLYLVMKRHK